MIASFLPSPPTLGIELEWQLIDRTTLDLRDGVMPLVDLIPDDEAIKPEIIQAAVETVTPPGESTAALRPSLREMVTRVSDAATGLGIALVGAGTHAFCQRLLPVTPQPRYVDMERVHGYLARTLVAYSLQAHVGMPSMDVAIRVLSDVRRFMPLLLALSASSPLFHGQATTFASYRHRILAATRSSGVAPSFEDGAEFLRFVDASSRAGMFRSFRDMHWDVRLRPDLGTIEVRIMDAQPTIDRSLALSALVHSLLVCLAAGDHGRRRVPAPLPWWIEKENAFRASHYGLEAAIIVAPDGSVEPLKRLAEELFELVLPTARSLGEEDDLARARAILKGGPSYLDQLAVFRRTGRVTEVVRTLANDLLNELGRPEIADAADPPACSPGGQERDGDDRERNDDGRHQPRARSRGLHR